MRTATFTYFLKAGLKVCLILRNTSQTFFYESYLYLFVLECKLHRLQFLTRKASGWNLIITTTVLSVTDRFNKVPFVVRKERWSCSHCMIKRKFLIKKTSFQKYNLELQFLTLKMFLIWYRCSNFVISVYFICSNKSECGAACLFLGAISEVTSTSRKLFIFEEVSLTAYGTL